MSVEDWLVEEVVPLRRSQRWRNLLYALYRIWTGRTYSQIP